MDVESSIVFDYAGAEFLADVVAAQPTSLIDFLRDQAESQHFAMIDGVTLRCLMLPPSERPGPASHLRCLVSVQQFLDTASPASAVPDRA